MLGIPIIARVAGLPADLEGIILRPKHRTYELFQGIELERAEATLLRARAVDQLAASVPKVAAENRRRVLAWKRDCFNARPLRAPEEDPAWQDLDPETSAALRRLVDLEATLARQAAELERSWLEERSEVRRVALEVAKGEEIQRGLCLASIGLVEGLKRLGADGLEKQGRKERKAEASLLRYLSRSALKLSPYSTLTTLALAKATPELSTSLKFFGLPEVRTSVVRVKRYLLDQSCDQLFLHREIRRHLLVGLNPSLEELGSGVYRFIKPHRLEIGEDEKLGYVVPSFVKVKLSGPLVPFIVERLRGCRCELGGLVKDIFERFGDEEEASLEQAEKMAEDLLRLGLIGLQTPWPGYHPLLEQNILAFLHRLPSSAIPAEYLRCLEELVWCEESFSATQDPAAAVRRIDELATSLYEAARFDHQSSSEVALQKQANRNYYEDVFWSTSAPAGGELVGVRQDAIASACEAGELIWQLLGVFEAKHEILALIDHLWQEKWPERDVIGLPVLFAEVKKEFERFLAHVAKRTSTPFDPQKLPQIEELIRLRRQIRQAFEEMVQFDGEVEVFPLTALRECLRRVPQALRSPVGPCLYLQPRNREATAWVANRIFEGSGRMSSRFAAVMPEALREAYVQHFVERSVVEHGEEKLELLDLLFTRSNTVNAHWPQTRKVLVVPGESCDLDAGRQVELRDLVVRRSVGAALRVGDRRGGSYLPCFLSPLQSEFVPEILKFLGIFSCDVRGRTSLSSRTLKRNGLLFQPRQVVGDLVIRRKRWVLQRQTVSGLDLAEGEAFCALNQWRLGLGIPDQVYLIEGVQELGPKPIWKPQYIDFRSPSFVSIFQNSIRQGEDEITIDEALPCPEDFPLDAEGRPRGVELMVESLARYENRDAQTGSIPAMIAGFV